MRKRSEQIKKNKSSIQRKNGLGIKVSKSKGNLVKQKRSKGCIVKSSKKIENRITKTEPVPAPPHVR